MRVVIFYYNRNTIVENALSCQILIEKAIITKFEKFTGKGLG